MGALYRCLVVAGIALLCVRQTINAAAPESKMVTVLFIGDSITADGRGQAAELAFLATADLSKDYRFIDCGESGTTSADWRPEGGLLPGAINAGTAAGATIAVLRIGTNDAKRANAITQATFEANVADTAAAVNAAGMVLIINQSPYPMPGAYEALWDANSPRLVQEYNSAEAELANGRTILLGSTATYARTQANPQLSDDGIHPNAAGYVALGDEDGVALLENTRPAFFHGESALTQGVYYLSFPTGGYFGYYSYLPDPNYIYHFDMGYEYVVDAADEKSGVYLYDFESQGFFYTSPSFPFPYLYDFSLNSVLYYFPDPNNPGRYNTNGTRCFYRFDNGQIIVK